MKLVFEKQKWSKILKANAEKFIHETVDPFKGAFYIRKLAKLIEMAMEEGREEVLDDPGSYDLVSESEPMRDESRD